MDICGHMEIRAKAHLRRARAAEFQKTLHPPHPQCLQSPILHRSCPGGLKYRGQRILTLNPLGTFPKPIHRESEISPKAFL